MSRKDQVLTSLYADISGDVYDVGDQIPNETQLAHDHGVSRSTIREAVRELVAIGVLEVRHGTGTFVKNIPRDGGGALRFEEQLRRMQAAELLEIRLVIEPQVAALAAERAQEVDLATLRMDVEALEKADPDGEALPEDMHFHLALVDATHNTFLKELVTWIIEFYEHDESRARSGDYEEHRQILDAIEHRDPSRARHSMMEHLATQWRLFFEGDPPALD